MSHWFYQQGTQEVGPFEREVLTKLRDAGVINDTTLVKSSTAATWGTLAELRAQESNISKPALSDSSQTSDQYYYLDEDRRTVGPFEVTELRRLFAQKIISGTTYVSRIGDPQWGQLGNLFGIPSIPTFSGSSVQAEQLPCYRSFEKLVKTMAITLSFYSFYIVPMQARDIEEITKKKRMDFTAALILGIVTFGIALAVMTVLWAFDLERHGKATGKLARQESLGFFVLLLNLMALVLGVAIGGFVLAFVLGGTLGAWAVWLLQKEINLYARGQDPAKI